MKSKLEYSSPEIIQFELRINNKILTGSSEGGSGNENYDNDLFSSSFEGIANFIIP